MPVLSKKIHHKYENELNSRFSMLMRSLTARDLKTNREGTGKGTWSNPEIMCATEGTPLDIRMAVEDFKSILAEVKKL